MNSKTLAPLLLVASLLSPSAHADAVDDYVVAEMAARRIPGLALAIVDHGRVVKEKAYGYANLELKAPATLDNVYAIASLTKVFTAAAVMKLVDRGSLTLDEPVTTKLTNLPASWNKVTVRQCLDHMSGLPDALDELEHLRGTDLDGLLRNLAQLRPEKPGDRSMYNQTGYILLATLLEKISGQSLEDFVKAEILEPLGMKDTRYADSRDVVPHRVTWYSTFVPSEDRKEWQWVAGMPQRSATDLYVNYATFPALMHCCGGLVTTLDDLIRFDRGIDAGKTMSPQTLRATLMPAKLNDGTTSLFSLGWTVGNSRGWLPGDTREGLNFMAFGGANSVAHWRFPDRQLTVIVLTNLQGSDAHTIALKIAYDYLKR
jgi:CubicO group peptidase (beta-lactamase class C family)